MGVATCRGIVTTESTGGLASISCVTRVFNSDFVRLRNSHECTSSGTIITKLTVLFSAPIAMVKVRGNEGAGRHIRHGFNRTRPRNCHGTLELVGRTRGFEEPILYLISADNTCPKVNTRRENRKRTVTRGLVRVVALGAPMLAILVNRNNDNNTLTLTISSRM